MQIWPNLINNLWIGAQACDFPTMVTELGDLGENAKDQTTLVTNRISS